MLDKLEKNKFVRLESSIEFGLEVYSLCVEANYKTGMAFALLQVGVAYCDMSNYEKAMLYLFDSINLAEEQSICDLQLLAYNNIGNIYFDIGEYEKSLDYYNSAKKLTKIFDHSKNYYKNLNSDFYAAKIYNNIGEIYRILKCYDDAITYYNLAVNLDRKSNDKTTFGIALCNLGNVEYHLGNYGKSLKYINESLTYLINNDDKVSIIEAYGTIALIHKKKLNYTECEMYFSKALDIASEISYGYAKIDLLLDFSNFLETVGKKQEAIDKIDDAYNISMEGKMYAKAMEINKRAVRMYEKVDDNDNSHRYYKLYFENEKKLEHIDLKNRTKNLKIKAQLDILGEENKSILEKSEVFRIKAEDLIERIKSMSIISGLGEKITTTLDLNQIYELLNGTIQTFMKASTFGVGLYNVQKRTIEYKYLVENNVRTEMPEVSFDSESSVAAKCLRENKIIIINDMQNEYYFYVDDINYISNNIKSSELNSAIYCPLIIDNNLIGVITIQAYEKNSFTMIIIEMIKALSSYAAIAINNAIKSMDLLIEVRQRRNVQTQLQNTNDKLIHLSENDGLTDIPNRRKFDSVLKEEWCKAKKKKSYLSMIIFDIDCFKQYNDNYGHTQGDNCLIKISNTLRESLVKNSFAARYGGDEFVIVLPNTNLEEALLYGENFRSKVENLSLTHEFSKVKETLTVTLGVASVIPNNDFTITEYITQADNALYEAKNKGRNQVIGYHIIESLKL